jgi:hypothetical protein
MPAGVSPQPPCAPNPDALSSETICIEAGDTATQTVMLNHKNKDLQICLKKIMSQHTGSMVDDEAELRGGS